jgi:phage portal protein BeeE
MMWGVNVSWSNYDREAIVKVYQTNPYVFSIVNRIARASVNVNWLFGVSTADGFEESEVSKYREVIETPNPLMSLSEFKESVAIFYYLFGECFIYFQRYEAGNNGGEIIPGTIQLAPPNLVDIQHENYIVTGYIINGDTGKPIDVNNMIHLKSFNPDYKDLHGLPYVAVAGTLIDKINAADATETKTFQNSGPSVMFTPNNAGDVEQNAFQNFISSLKSLWKKDENKRGIVGLNIPLKVERFGANPVEMGTIESQKNTVRILLVLWNLDAGLFDIEASTFNNKMTMERTIYTEAAIPFSKKLIDKLNAKFANVYNDEIVYDTSEIEALQPNYKEKVEWMGLAGVFTDNQMLEALGYDQRESAISDMTPNEMMNSVSLAGFNDEDLNKNVIES